MLRKFAKLCIATTAAVTLTALASQSASAEAVYAVKFVCGNDSANLPIPEGSEHTVRGYYRTVINVYNPANQTELRFVKKPVRLLPQTGERFPAGERQEVVLGPMEGEGIDCNDIRILLAGAGIPVPIAWWEGMLDIRVPTGSVLPKVTAVYTAKPTVPSKGTVGVHTIDVEDIQPIIIDDGV